MTLEEQLKAAEKSGTSEGKLLAELVRSIIEEEPYPHQLITSSLHEIIEWAEVLISACRDESPYEANVSKRCGAEMEPGGYRCTCTKGHDGDHLAHGTKGVVIMGWGNEL